jgi:uncharacterized damage-inducible protein DinB
MAVTTNDASSATILKAIDDYLEVNRKKSEEYGHEFARLRKELEALEKLHKSYLQSAARFLERSKEMLLLTRTTIHQNPIVGSEGEGAYIVYFTSAVYESNIVI